MSRPLTIGRLDLALRDQSHAARAETLVRDALRTASFPGLPAGALIALRHFDLGEISCTQSAQSIALQIDQRFLTLPHTAVYISHDSAIHAAVVWAEDHYDALRTVAQAYYQRHPSKHAWFWPLLLSPWQHQASSAQGLTHVLTRAATQMPDPFHGLHNLFKTVSESVRSGLIQALDHKLIRWLAAALPTSSAALPLLPSDLPAAPQSLITAAHHWGAHDQRSRLLAAIWCAKSGAEQHDVASAAQSLLQQWFTPTVAKLTTVARKTTHSTVNENVLSRASPGGKSADIPAAPLEQQLPRSGLETAAKIVFEPTLLNTVPKTRSHLPSQTAHEKGLASPEPDSLVIKQESAPQWDGQPSSYAGAIFLILLIQRALTSTSQLTHAHLTHAQRQALIFRLARQAGTPRRDPVLSWLSLPLLPSLIASTNAERKAACRWLRQHNKGNKGNKGNKERLDDRRLTLRQLVKRPGLIRATTHHIDVTFPINSADIRIRRLGLDLNPGWVPWLGKIIGIHFQAMPNLGGDF